MEWVTLLDMLKLDYSLPGLGFPRRPSWNYEMTRENLLRKEEKSYRDYLDDLSSRNPPGSLSHFEHNLEVIDTLNCFLINKMPLLEPKLVVFNLFCI